MPKIIKPEDEIKRQDIIKKLEILDINETNDIIEKPVHIGVDTINTINTINTEINDIISVSYKQKKGKTFIIREIIRNMKQIPKGIVFYQQTILPADDFKIEDFNEIEDFNVKPSNFCNLDVIILK